MRASKHDSRNFLAMGPAAITVVTDDRIRLMSANSSTLAGKGSSSRPIRAGVYEELAQYDGQVPVRPTQFGCAGYVYDVSRLFMWMTGRHFRLQAGRDLAGRMSEGPR